ncbi:hypothetical protein FEM48_Zijuj03G0096900 [Ziziphus jujuba var. spinosa]|uniref:Maternal effect embryo arrest 60 n=1 Tax=Ziziphus jujuba var. spinosa TaxID=714518 RepID=A0A978VPK0_ZIZJJ|nr:hypothetical protein FEM48_Zijuj03G0096900 [Ziziphus jujuba var. spinosa]
MASGGTNIHVTALDGIVNVNSLFTLAVFVGLTWNPRDPANTLIDSPNCIPGHSVAEDLVSFHVYSFSSFLFSSLVAMGLKQAIRIARSPAYHPSEFLVRVNKSAFRAGMLVSGAGSVSGCVFLMLALINVVQIKLGTLACGSSHSFAAVIPLVIFVPSALLIYISIVFFSNVAGFFLPSNDQSDQFGRCHPWRNGDILAAVLVAVLLVQRKRGVRLWMRTYEQ